MRLIDADKINFEEVFIVDVIGLKHGMNIANERKLIIKGSD